MCVAPVLVRPKWQWCAAEVAHLETVLLDAAVCWLSALQHGERGFPNDLSVGKLVIGREELWLLLEAEWTKANSVFLKPALL